MAARTILNVRVDDSLRVAVQTAAALRKMPISEWHRRALETIARRDMTRAAQQQRAEGKRSV